MDASPADAGAADATPSSDSSASDSGARDTGATCIQIANPDETKRVIETAIAYLTP